MSVYDKNGNIISGSGTITDDDIRNAFLAAIADGTINPGSAIGATLSVQTYSAAWEANAKTAYNSMLAEFRTKANSCIPFFISTDQHGSGLQQHRYINNIDTDGMNIVNINLGDTVQDVYGEGTIQGFRDTTKQVKNYIGVVGNHEVKHSADRMYESTLSKVFTTTNLPRRSAPSKSDCYAVDDGVHAVRWIVLEDYYLNADGTGYTHGFDGATVEWLISELSKDDMDCIILMHWPCWRTARQRNESSESADTGRWHVDAYLLWDFFVARKNKTSGTFNDISGAAHTYDFRACKKDLLCTLHGHTHSEWMSTDYGLTAYAADRYDSISAAETKCIFGMVDRIDNKLRIWEFCATEVTEELQLPI